jgi:hypothetical protein
MCSTILLTRRLCRHASKITCDAKYCARSGPSVADHASPVFDSQVTGTDRKLVAARGGIAPATRGFSEGQGPHSAPTQEALRSLVC